MRLPPCFALLTVCAIVLGAMPVCGQDDSGASSQPQADNAQAPMQDNGGAGPVPDNGAPAANDGNGAPEMSATFQTFYDALSNLGTWIQSNDYGYVWQPQENDPDWAPYTEGHWVYTDDGWTWASDEPFGWATYHYGRWVNLDGTGWVWVPGYTWAPAWVSWRYGNGYAGWAPLPPDSFVGVDYSDDGASDGVGFHIGGDCDAFYGIGPGCYNFLPVGCLGYRSYHGSYCHRGDNYAIINGTTNVTNINVTHGGANTVPAAGGNFPHVTTGGPMLAEVNAASAAPVQRVNLVRTSQPNGGGMLTGNSLALFAPRVHSGALGQPGRVAGSIGNASINRGADVMRPLEVNSHLGGAAATEAQVQHARIAQNHAPASAKVMTDESSVRPVLQAPLTSMRPVATPERTFNTTPNAFSNTPRGTATTQVVPTVRVYPQANEQGGVPSQTYYRTMGPNTYPGTVRPSGSPTYQPRTTTVTSPGFAPQTQTYVRPTAPAGSYPAAPAAVHETAPAVHQQQQSSQGGTSSGGGYSNGGAAAGTYHPGANSQQSH